MTPERALQEAITTLLLGDPAVSAIVGQKIFDEVPSDKSDAPPWVYLGPISRRRLDGAGCDQAWTITMRLYAASTKFGRKDAWELGNAVSEALEGQEPALAGSYAVAQELRCIQAGDVIAPATPKTVFVDVTTIIAKP